MPIFDNEILWRASALRSDATPAQNGGRMSFTQLVSGVKNNLFPDVSQAERLAGAVKWRKAFIHVNSAIDTALLNVRIFLDALTPAGDFVTFYAGTQTDTESQIAGRPYGIGALNASVTSGTSQIQVVCEHNAEYAVLLPFRIGDLVRVSYRPGSGGTGNEEWVTLTGVSYGVDYAVLDLSAPLANNYAASNTLVSSVLQQASVAGTADGLSVTSTAGSFDALTVGNWIAHNRGAIEEHWTLNFSTSTGYSVTGLSTGALMQGGSPIYGSTTADFSPINPATLTPYFTLKATGWTGSFMSGDQVSFDTHPASIPIWYRRQVPAGTFSLANDYASLAIHGESA